MSQKAMMLVSPQRLLDTLTSNLNISLSNARQANLHNIIESAQQRSDDVSLALLGAVDVRNTLEEQLGRLTGAALGQAISRLNRIQEEADNSTPTYTLENALSEDTLASTYRIDPSAMLRLEDYTVTELTQAQDDIEDIVDQAQNADALDLSELLEWTLRDRLDALTQAPQVLREGAESYRISNADTQLGVLSPEALNVLQGAANAEDYTYATAIEMQPGITYDASGDDFVFRFAEAPMQAAIDNFSNGDIVQFSAEQLNGEDVQLDYFQGDLDVYTSDFTLLATLNDVPSSLSTSSVTLEESADVFGDWLQDEQGNSLIFAADVISVENSAHYDATGEDIRFDMSDNNALNLAITGFGEGDQLVISPDADIASLNITAGNVNGNNFELFINSAEFEFVYAIRFEAADIGGQTLNEDTPQAVLDSVWGNDWLIA